jgi:hypothetical protein
MKPYNPYPRRRRILVRTAYVLLRAGAIRRRTFAAIIHSVMGEYR